jgi:nucleoside 2-deoxyribosyltransferase
MYKVYLAGPITGSTYEETISWRNHATAKLLIHNIEGLSPMRGKAFLDNNRTDCDITKFLSGMKAITTRDKWDCERCDAVLVNLLGAKKVSIGTVLEIGWASSAGKPIVLVMEKEGNIHEHGIIRELCGFQVETLEDGLKTVINLF